MHDDDNITTRQRLVEGEVEWLVAAVLFSVPTVLAVMAFFAPMFAFVDVGEESQDPLLERSTMIGLVVDNGGSGHSTAISVVALVAVAALAVALLAVPAWVRERSPAAGWVIPVAAAVSFAASAVLWWLTVQNDGEGSLGTERVDPSMELLLAFLVPVWLVVARARSGVE